MAKDELYREGMTGTHPNYDDDKTLNSYCTSKTPFPDAEGVVRFAGFGATKDDLERGFCRPTLNDMPEYDMDNYKKRWTTPMVSDLVEDGPATSRDMEFRTKDLESKGFLVRPHLPIER